MGIGGPEETDPPPDEIQDNEEERFLRESINDIRAYVRANRELFYGS